MGTRHLIEVISDNELKIAQYGQWDGYLEGQGETIRHFLSKMDKEKFKNNLKKCQFLSEEEIEKRILEFSEDGDFTLQESDNFKKKYLELHRDIGANILNLVYNGEAKNLQNDADFKNDKLYCEYDYLINLDNDTIAINDYVLSLEEFVAADFKELEKKIQNFNKK